MEILQLKKYDPEWKQAWELYKEAVEQKAMLYTEMEFEVFRDKFSCEKKEVATVNLIEKEGTAFASGCLDKRSGKLFITMIIVHKNQRRQGKGKEILTALEQSLEAEAACPNNSSIYELSFFNPNTLTWNIPDQKGVTHPNSPGIDVGSSAYLFFKNCGYREFALQNSYYLNLTAFEYPRAYQEKKQKLEQEGITFQIYDSKCHQGMEDMLKGFGNSMWEDEILAEPNIAEGGRPILVPIQNGHVLGFTGPLSVELGGRGYFAGIAVSADIRGKGLGKLLFHELCNGLKKQGALYMTLFTGENNPARNIYEEVGFQIVRSWSDMRKTKK